jgi:hypothetical protein
MTDDSALTALREEIERQRQVADERHQALVSELRRQGRPLTQSQASATMRSGYEQSEAAREASQQGEGGGE